MNCASRDQQHASVGGTEEGTEGEGMQRSEDIILRILKAQTNAPTLPTLLRTWLISTPTTEPLESLTISRMRLTIFKH